jgi:hypothetical protein
MLTIIGLVRGDHDASARWFRRHCELLANVELETLFHSGLQAFDVALRWNQPHTAETFAETWAAALTEHGDPKLLTELCERAIHHDRVFPTTSVILKLIPARQYDAGDGVSRSFAARDSVTQLLRAALRKTGQWSHDRRENQPAQVQRQQQFAGKRGIRERLTAQLKQLSHRAAD